MQELLLPSAMQATPQENLEAASEGEMAPASKKWHLLSRT